ncbi:hypothetical protein E2320_000290 [Naja naja]|nr:hypothetical protein E2320_000290 [Naja naja]
MKKLRHARLVRLYAVVTQRPMFIITEYMEKGELLRMFPPISYGRSLVLTWKWEILQGVTLDLGAWEESWDGNAAQKYVMCISSLLTKVAEGMAFLEKKNYIHRDLRAANIWCPKASAARLQILGWPAL